MVDSEIFSRWLDALEGYLARLRRLGEMPESDYLAEPGIHDLAARYLHLVVEASIDLANHCIADQDLRTPDSNRDSFTVLEEAGEMGATPTAVLTPAPSSPIRYRGNLRRTSR